MLTNEGEEEKACEHTNKAFHSNNTWEAISNKWVYKIKTVDDEAKYKVRLVAKGYAQTKGIDFHEVCSPMVKMTTLRMLFAIMVALDLELEQMYVHKCFCMVTLM
mgnify:FL=1